MILKLTNTLHYKLISDYNLGAAKDIIETLCWFEKSVTFAKYTAPSNLIHLTAMTLSNLSQVATQTYSEDDYDKYMLLCLINLQL